MAYSNITSTEGRAFLTQLGYDPNSVTVVGGVKIPLSANNTELDKIAQEMFTSLDKLLTQEELTGYDPTHPMPPNLMSFMLDWAEEESVDQGQIKDKLVTRVKKLIDDGRTVDPAWLDLMFNSKFGGTYFTLDESRTYLQKALSNFADAGVAAPADFLKYAYLNADSLQNLSASTVSKLVLNSIRDGGSLPKELIALVQNVSTFNAIEAANIAKDVLNTQVANRQPLDKTMLSLLKSIDSNSYGEILVAKAMSMAANGGDGATKGVKDYTTGIEAPIYDYFDKLKSEDPARFQDFAVSRLKYQISSTGELGASKFTAGTLEYLAVDWLNSNKPNAYRDVLVYGLDVQSSRNKVPEDDLLKKLKELDPFAASQYVVSYSQKKLAQNGYLEKADVDRLKAYTSGIDNRSLASIAQYALADAFKRGIKITLPPPVPVPSSATAEDLGLYALYNELETLNPVSAQEWAASFTARQTKSVSEIPLSDEQKTAVSAWSSLVIKWTGSDPTINGEAKPLVDLGADLETSLMTVFMGRATQLEAQLKAQIDSVQAKNDQMGRMNEAMGLLNKVSKLVASDAKSSDKIKDKSDGKLSTDTINQVVAALKAAGVTPFANGFSGDLTKGELAGGIQQLKTQIDSLGNNQQTEMIRLQSLTTKRNESFEIISTFLAKIAGVNEKILGNMH
jgi:hypothetical protein